MSAVVVVPVAVALGISAVTDWVAVARQRRAVELAAKPLTLALLIGLAATLDLGSAKGWVLAALALGLIGDVALLFSPDEADEGLDAAFLAGLTAFLLGHIAYLGAFAARGVHGWQAAAGTLVVVGASALVVPRVLRGARLAGGMELAVVVAIYAAVLAIMVVLAFATGAIATAIGGLVFLASDTTLAWNRFVQRLVRGPLIVIVTYHVAQVLIVAGLAH